MVGPQGGSSSYMGTVSGSQMGLTVASQHPCRGRDQSVQPTGRRSATWFLEGARQVTQDRKPRIGSNLGQRPGRSRCSAVAGKVPTERSRCLLLRAGIAFCLCQALSD